MKTYILILISTLLSISARPQEIFPGGIIGVGGSYNATYSPSPCAFAKRPIGNTPGITKASTYPGPFQTHNWWNSALWNVDYSSNTKDLHSDHMHPHPLILDAVSNGLVLRHRTKDYMSDVDVSNYYVADQDVRVYLKNKTATRTNVEDYGHWHVKMVQETGGGDNLHFTGAAGCPYVFFQKEGNADPMIYGANIRVFATNASAIGFTVNSNAFFYPDVHYALFIPNGTQISINNGSSFINHTTLTADQNIFNDIQIRLPSGVDYFSVALLPQASISALTLFTTHAFNFITGTDFSYFYHENTAAVTNIFTATTVAKDGTANEGTLQALYRHQYLYSPEATTQNTGYTYMSPRGPMQLIKGNNFNTIMKHHGILPSLAFASKADKARLFTLCTEYSNSPEISNPSSFTGDSYNVFIMISQAARIAEIAHQVGNYTARNRCLDAAKYHIEDWLTSPSTEHCKLVHYSTDFNWMTYYPDAFNADIGMHDAHFVTGYLIYGAAMVGRYEKKRTGNMNWVNSWKPMIDLLVRNINDWNKTCASTPSDPYNPCFPYLRFFDPYAGHSWAHSYTENQESVSEAVQFAAGAMMWGEITGNIAMRDMGAMLFVNESEAGRQYWHDVDNTNVNRAPFSHEYPYNHAGIVYKWGAAYRCFFGNEPYQFHGITYWPITGASVWMGVNPAGAERNYNDFLTAYGKNVSGTNAEDYWTSEMLSYMALFNASAAHSTFIPAVLNNPSVFDKNAVYKSHQINAYHWIGTLDSVGRVDANTSADIAFYSVFVKDNCKHYMIYNAPNNPARQVKFSDGQEFTVPSDTLIVFKVCSSTLPVQLLNFSAAKKGTDADILWQVIGEEENTHYVLEKSKDGKSFFPLAEIKGRGAYTGIYDYLYHDPLLFSGNTFYRLKIDEPESAASYSKIVVVSNNSIASVSELFPNPASTHINFYIFDPEYDWIDYIITDISGKEITRGGSEASVGTKISIDVSSLSSGAYFLNLKEDKSGSVVIKKFVK
ncbi:MAG: glycosyl hydrolase [Cytophagaceae bacterium]